MNAPAPKPEKVQGNGLEILLDQRQGRPEAIYREMATRAFQSCGLLHESSSSSSREAHAPILRTYATTRKKRQKLSTTHNIRFILIS